ncbi:MAG: hypothetical protein ACERKY_12430 [Anaerolineales bacterium]
MIHQKKFLRSGNRWITITFLVTLTLQGCTLPPSSTKQPSIQPLQSTPTTYLNPTKNPESSDTPEVIPTKTPEPTLSMNEAEQAIYSMIENNGECRFPCIWGYQSGIDGEVEINLLHSSFSPEYFSDNNLIVVDRFGDHGGIAFITTEDDLQINIDMSYYFNGQETLKLIEFKAKSFKISGEGIDLRLDYLFGNHELNELVNYYILASLLNEYGEPSSILIAPNFHDRPEVSPPSWLWYSVVLIYEDQGFLVEYIMPRRWIGDSLAACVNQVTEITVIGWDPQQEIDLREALSIKSGLGIHENNISYFKTLEEATSLSISEFTEIFSDPDTEACVFTPLEMWPHPTIPD